MSGMAGSSSPSGAQLSRSDTPGLPTANPGPSGGGGKLLLSREAQLVTSSLIQPGSVPGAQPQSENEKVYYLIVDLMSPTTREGALLELSKKREQWDDLALVLWHSFGKPTLALACSATFHAWLITRDPSSQA